MEAARHKIEGGVQPLVQVEFFPELIFDGSLLYNAARTAKKFHDHRDRLPFVMPSSPDEDLEDITLINWNSAAEGTVTLHDHAESLKTSKSFITCVSRLIEVSGVVDPGFIGIMVEPGWRRRAHYDGYDGSRSLLLLQGMKVIEFDHEPVHAYTKFVQSPGHAYKMEFTENPETDLLHGVECIEDEQVTVYVQEVY